MRFIAARAATHLGDPAPQRLVRDPSAREMRSTRVALAVSLALTALVLILSGSPDVVASATVLAHLVEI
jgi:hypothetical protein